MFNHSIRYLGSVLTDDGKCDTEIWRHMEIVKNTSQKLSKVLRHQKMSGETKKRVLCNLLYDGEWRTLFSQTKKRLEAMWLYKWITWTDYVRIKKVLRGIGSKIKKILLTFRKRELKF